MTGANMGYFKDFANYWGELLGSTKETPEQKQELKQNAQFISELYQVQNNIYVNLNALSKLNSNGKYNDELFGYVVTALTGAKTHLQELKKHDVALQALLMKLTPELYHLNPLSNMPGNGAAKGIRNEAVSEFEDLKNLNTKADEIIKLLDIVIGMTNNNVRDGGKYFKLVKEICADLTTVGKSIARIIELNQSQLEWSKL